MPLIRRPSSASPPERAAGDLASPEPDARWAAARRLRTPEDVATLAAALEGEDDPRVREAIFTSLSRIGGPESARSLAGQIRSDDAALRTGALDALRAMPADLAEVLPALLADRDSDVRLLACELARDAPAPAAGQLLCGLLAQETEPNVVGAAVEVLAEIGGPEAGAALDRCGERFGGEPFLVFAIRTARERIGAR
jgi:HEAT repeat protein